MAEDSDICLNIVYQPVEKNTNKKRKSDESFTKEQHGEKKNTPKFSKPIDPKRKVQLNKRGHKHLKETNDEGTGQDYKSSGGGKISSLFGNNPDIPAFARRVVKPVREEVFSGTQFKDFPIHRFTVSNLEGLGMTQLTTVQQKAIPVLLEGSDTLIRSQTGSGKTLAYALPIVEALQQVRPELTRADGVQALVVVPTRELALQTYEWFLKLVKPFMRLVPGYLVGGEKRKSEKARLRKGITVLVGTPGRLVDHVTRTRSLLLNRVRWLVLDEADRLLDMGYERDVASLVSALDDQDPKRRLLPPREGETIKREISRQTVLLSATLTPAVERLAGLTLQSPVFVDAADVDQDETVVPDLSIPDKLVQSYMVTPAKLRLVSLASIIIGKSKFTGQRKMLLFCATQDMVDYLTELLTAVLSHADQDDSDSDGENEGPQVDIDFLRLHGSMDQKERTEVFRAFRSAESGVLLCTDVAARGLDLPHVDLIIQYTAPATVADYVHRVGRTARVDTAGAALLFLVPSELEFLRRLEDRRIRLQEEKMDKCLQKLVIASSSSSGRQRPPNTVEAAATAMQSRFETSVLERRSLHDLACKAYVSWVRFYASYPKETREVFNFKALHLGHFAKSFALRDPPTTIGGIGRRQYHLDNKNRKTKKTHDGGAARNKRSARVPPGHSLSRTRELVTSEYASGLEPLKKKAKLM